MKKHLTIIMICLFVMNVSAQDANAILDKIDKNMSSDNRVIKSEMLIHGKRKSRTITSISYSIGDTKSFSEYLSPVREKGTKMLKLEDQLWIYSPGTDRTIQISGHMLKQSLMGSDLSYEDMMDNSKLTDAYIATITGQEEYNDRSCFVLELIAKIEDVSYQKRVMWVDSERYIPLKEDLFAKSGQLLKRTELKDVERIEGRWFPKTIVFKDMLKKGDGTEFRMIDIKFNQDIPEHIFTKASLKK